MSFTISPNTTSMMDSLIRPRPTKHGNPLVSRTQSEDAALKPSQGIDAISSSISRYPQLLKSYEISIDISSSGRSTPIPHDAPPSAKSISSARKQIRAQQKHRIFPSIDYFARVSHFDRNSDYRDFRGFFVLFWIGLAIMVLTTMLRNIKDTGYPLRVRMWALLTANTCQLAFSDLAMVGSSVLVLPMQRMFRKSKGGLRWSKGGMPMQSVFQAVWLIVWVK